MKSIPGMVFQAGMGCLGGLFFHSHLFSQNPPSPPVNILLVGTPFSKPAELSLRGNGLDLVTEVQFQSEKPGAKPIPLKILKKEKNALPGNRPVARVGEWLMQAESKTVPNDEKGTFQFFGKEKKILFDFSWPLKEQDFQLEKEPNNGFLDANQANPEVWIQGTISPAKDVDVFALVLPTGKTKVEIVPGKSGTYSLLDAFVMIHNERGDLVNEFPLSLKDSRVVNLGKPGKYFFSIMDINDMESEFHHYQFKLVPR